MGKAVFLKIADPTIAALTFRGRKLVLIQKKPLICKEIQLTAVVIFFVIFFVKIAVVFFYQLFCRKLSSRDNEIEPLLAASLCQKRLIRMTYKDIFSSTPASAAITESISCSVAMSGGAKRSALLPAKLMRKP